VKISGDLEILPDNSEKHECASTRRRSPSKRNPQTIFLIICLLCLVFDKKKERSFCKNLDENLLLVGAKGSECGMTVWISRGERNRRRRREMGVCEEHRKSKHSEKWETSMMMKKKKREEIGNIWLLPWDPL
jgi:hypothetical protein